MKLETKLRIRLVTIHIRELTTPPNRRPLGTFFPLLERMGPRNCCGKMSHKEKCERSNMGHTTQSPSLSASAVLWESLSMETSFSMEQMNRLSWESGHSSVCLQRYKLKINLLSLSSRFETATSTW